ncbi:hypothetical protein [Rhodococcus jostii]|uniref:hypothetical protein n=1 Tax=Rhodococcus jostii TaxID=132919 RepID=UPI003651BC9A
MADFGMDAAAFFRHLAEYLELSPPTPLRPDLLERMTAVARRRLWLPPDTPQKGLVCQRRHHRSAMVGAVNHCRGQRVGATTPLPVQLRT